MKKQLSSWISLTISKDNISKNDEDRGSIGRIVRAEINRMCGERRKPRKGLTGSTACSPDFQGPTRLCGSSVSVSFSYTCEGCNKEKLISIKISSPAKPTNRMGDQQHSLQEGASDARSTDLATPVGTVLSPIVLFKDPVGDFPSMFIRP